VIEPTVFKLKYPIGRRGRIQGVILSAAEKPDFVIETDVSDFALVTTPIGYCNLPAVTIGIDLRKLFGGKIISAGLDRAE
jgi:hypothetical protein